MAVFDRDTAKFVVRVVYDGPGNAGKTTNLVEICQFFTTRRRSELFSPEVREGRTVWFDWLQIDGGLVAGYGLRCQVVTVPGQLVLRRRRSALLRAADVVVMVCDSTPAGLDLVRPAFGRIRQFVAEQAGAEVPIVVQANKQDLPGALPADEIAAALGADASIPVVAARANASVGVKETLVLAIRAAADRAHQLMRERGIDGMAGEPGDAQAVLAELRRLDDVRDGALDELLARPAFVEESPPARMPRIPPPRAVAVSAAAIPALAVPRTATEGEGSIAGRGPRDSSARGNPRGATGRIPRSSVIAAASRTLPMVAPGWWPLPPLGDTEIGPGNLWPAATGRDALRGLTEVVLRPRLDRVAQHGDRDGSGRSSTVIYQAGDWCLKTSTARRFDDLDAARVALVKLARTKIALGALTLPSTVLVIFGDADAGYWIWTFAPWRPTLRGAMTEAEAAGDTARLGDALVRFAGAIGEALVRAVRNGQGLDLHPSNFALDGGALFYLDDDVTAAPPVPGAAHAILQRAEELPGHRAAIERYAASLIEELGGQLTADELARSQLIEDLDTTAPRSPLARSLRAQLLRALHPAWIERGAAWQPAAARISDSAPGAGPEGLAGDEPVAEAAPVVEPSVLAEASAPVASRAAEAWPLPPVAAEHLPSGFIWPVVAGRELVRQVLRRTPTRRDALPFTYDLGDYTLSTSSDRRFSEVDDGRAELLRLARAQVARGAMPPGVVLVLAPDDARGGHWIWTLEPAAGGAGASP